MCEDLLCHKSISCLCSAVTYNCVKYCSIVLVDIIPDEDR